MNNKTANEIIEKSKIKKDGVYSHKGIKFIVVGGRFKAWCKYKEVYEKFGSFFVKIGMIDEIYNRDKELRRLLKQYQHNGRD